MHTLSVVIFHPFALKGLRDNEILRSIKCHNSVTKVPIMIYNHSNVDLIHINLYVELGEILSICSQDIEQKRNSDMNKWGR